MNSISFPFNLNDRQLEEIQYRYALLEPLLDEYLSRQEKREYAETIRQELRISERTLRRYLQRFREQGGSSAGAKETLGCRAASGVFRTDSQAGPGAFGAKSPSKPSHAHGAALRRCPGR